MKSYTDIDQSKKLAEILPLESADILIGNYVGKSGKVDGTNIHYYPKGESFGAPEIIPAWSLAGLLSMLPKSLIYTPSPFLKGYCCKSIEYDVETYGDDSVDACYEMIVWLKENGKI